MHKCELNFLDVLAGKTNVSDVVYKNYGIKVVPTGFRFEDIQDVLAGLKKERVEQSIAELLRQTEFLLIDAPAGIADSTIISILAAREMIPVTNPRFRRCYLVSN
jgi:septum site-determining protein MinD